MSDQPRYEWVPLTEAQRDEMSGLTEIRAKANAGDPVAQLFFRRLEAAQAALQPTLDAFADEILTSSSAKP
jgi:hypothetical protein